MSDRSGKTPKCANIALFSTQRTTMKHSNFLSPPCVKESHQRSLIQSKISKIFTKNKSVDILQKNKHLKSTGSIGSNYSYASKVSKVSNVKLTTVPKTAIGKKLQMNRSQLMVPKKSTISRQKLLNTARPEQFNQTFGVETLKVPKNVKIKKAVLIKKTPV
jgi:hypothetical protein